MIQLTAFTTVTAFIKEHSEFLTLFMIAMAVTMRKRLPPPLDKVEFLEWWYEWLRDGLLTLISMRGPSHTEAQQSIKVTHDEDGKVIETATTSASATKAAN